MIVLGPLIEIVIIAINLYVYVVIAQAILSWLIAFNVINTSNQLVYTIASGLYRITEPALRPLRRFIPSFGGIDVTPVVLILVLYFLQRVLQNLLFSMQSGQVL